MERGRKYIVKQQEVSSHWQNAHRRPELGLASTELHGQALNRTPSSKNDKLHFSEVYLETTWWKLCWLYGIRFMAKNQAHSLYTHTHTHKHIHAPSKVQKPLCLPIHLSVLAAVFNDSPAKLFCPLVL